MRGKTLLVLAGLLGAGLLGYRNLPPHLNPLAPLALDDPPGWLTSFKLRRLTADQCASLLAEANRRRLIASRPVADSEGSCPLRNVVRVANFGSVQLSSSFLASCPLALSSALYIEQQAKPLTRQLMASDLRQIDHLGSFACRNIYHRQQARRSEHATADALDVSGFRLADGRRRRRPAGAGGAGDARPGWRRVLFEQQLRGADNALGPEYNAAHANHFHFGMRGQGFCF